MTKTISHSVVEYASYDDMKCAMRKLNGADLNGRKLKLHEDYRGSRRKTCVIYKVLVLNWYYEFLKRCVFWRVMNFFYLTPLV